MNPAEQLVQQDGHVLGAAAVPPQGPPQLPPQMFTTAAQLLDLTDSRYLSRIRDLCVSQPHFKNRDPTEVGAKHIFCQSL